MKFVILAALAILSFTNSYSMKPQNMIHVSQDSRQWAAEQIKEMTIDEKIGQLFMLAIWSEWSDDRMSEIYAEAEKYRIGGACFFAGEAARQIEVTNKLNADSKLPLMIGIDGEWGAGMRVTDAHKFPYAMNVGAVADSSLVYEMGRQIGQHCARLGVHVNFAPVHDLNSNPLNPVINYRSFGSDPEDVSIKVRNYISGMQSEGVLAVAKHFPGHGDTHTDSHHALPVINRSRKEFEEREFIPFRSSIKFGLQALMMGHLSVPALDKNDMPASLSSKIIKGIVKRDFGFDGLIVSDALNMDAVAKGYKNHYLKAFIAGNDILLFPADLGEGVNQIKKGLLQNKISVADIDERCVRVLAYKHALGAHEFSPISDVNVVADINTPESAVLNRKLLSQSITLVKNDDDLLPIKNLSTKRIAVVSVNGDNPKFGEQCRQYADVAVFNEKINTSEDIAKLLTALQSYDEIIVGLHGEQKSKGGNYGISDAAISFLNQLAQQKSVHAVVLANPYSVRKLSKTNYGALSSLMFTYSDDLEIQRLAADAIFGGIACQGILPLDINDFLKVGLGVTTEQCRLGYTSVPEEVGLNSDTLQKIDKLIEEVITEKMTPGCQVLIAKKGKVAYHKAFGFHTYDKTKKVEIQHIYDIASITKIAATTPVVMQLVDSGHLSLETYIEEYLPELENNPRGKFTLKELLMHQSGLQSYIGFDFNLIDEEKSAEKLFSRNKSSEYCLKLTPSIYMSKNIALKDGCVFFEENDSTIKVAEGMYVSPTYKEEMYRLIDEFKLNDDKKYRYSDLGFYYVMRVIEKQIGEKINDLAYQRLYAPLGMYRTFYNPLESIVKEDIVPTVKEEFFRNQLLHGYVHDQGAALIGGVAAHAGIFSNANDLAKLMQMLMNDGFYGRESYIKPTTVNYFTQHTEQGYRRGLGFDKPEGNVELPQPTCEAVPLSAFGHTGFTGTCVWADPENELIYIFLSNRVHPHSYNTKLFDENIRPRIQEIIYNAIQF